MTGLDLGHVSKLHEIQNKRRKLGLPDRMFASRVEDLIREFSEGGVGTREEDVRYLQAKRYCELSRRALKLPERTLPTGELYAGMDVYVASIPEIPPKMFAAASIDYLLLVDPRFDTAQLCQRAGITCKVDPSSFSPRCDYAEPAVPYWTEFRAPEYRTPTSLFEIREEDGEISLLAGLTLAQGVCLYVQHPHLFGTVLLAGSIKNSRRGKHVACITRGVCGMELCSVHEEHRGARRIAYRFSSSD